MKYDQGIENRKQILIALSEFYLDTELASEDYDRIASIFKNSGLNLNDIKEIDLMEVFLLLQPNLLGVAGEWVGFNREWLLTQCEKRYNRRKKIFYRLKCKFWNIFFYWMRKDHWNQIEKRMITAGSITSEL